MSKAAVPVIDISPYRGADAAARRTLAAEVDRTCREIGFMVISGHGIDPDLIAAVEDVSRTFFDLPLEDKMQIVRPAPDVTRGYMPMKAEVLVRSRGGTAQGDLNESLMIGPVDVTDAPYYTSPAAGRHFAKNLWPERPPGLRQVYERYYRVMDALAIDLMRLFATGAMNWVMGKAFPDDVPLEAKVERRAIPFEAAGRAVSLDLRVAMGRRWLKGGHEVVAGMAAGHHEVARQRVLGRAHRPDMKVMDAGDARQFLKIGPNLRGLDVGRHRVHRQLE